MVKGAIIDLDGTIYKGNLLLPFASEFVKNLRKNGVKILFLTNNSQRTPAFYSRKLSQMGIKTNEREILTSAKATAKYIKNNYPSAIVYPIGEDGLISELIENHIEISYDHTIANMVVVGYDTYFTYEKLKKAALLISNGSIFIGCNPDKTLPSEEGNIPGNGAQLAFLVESTGKTPYIIGKPNLPIMTEALKILGTAPKDTLVIGDRYETDILAGINIGAQTALVLTGVTTKIDSTKIKKIDFVVKNLKELWNLLSR